MFDETIESDGHFIRLEDWADELTPVLCITAKGFVITKETTTAQFRKPEVN